MIQSTPNYIISYTATDKHGQKEEATVLAPVQDYATLLKELGYRHIEIQGVRPI